VSDPITSTHTATHTGSGSGGQAQLTLKDSWQSPAGYTWQLMSDGLTFSIQGTNTSIDAATMQQTLGGPWDSCEALFNQQGAAGWEPENPAARQFHDACNSLSDQIDRAAGAAAGVAGTVEAVNPWVGLFADCLTIVGAFIPLLGSIGSELKSLEVKAEDAATKIANEAIAGFQTGFDLANAGATALTKNAVLPDLQTVHDDAVKMLTDVANIVKAALS
jgi:hypothetical protein